MTTTFPSLTPSSRVITSGTRQFEEVAAGDGDLDRVRLSAALVGQTISLTFTALSISQAQQIQGHWLRVRGTSTQWPLSDAVWGGVARSVPLTPANYGWRYESPPKTKSRSGGPGVPRFDVTVSIVMQPPAQVESGSDLTVQVPYASVLVEAVAPAVDADLLVNTSFVEVITVAAAPVVVTD